MKDLELDISQLREIAAALAEKVEAGLRSDGQQIACLPTYLNLPTGTQEGQALVIDTGGTNTRAARVELSPRDGEITHGPQSCKVPDGRDGQPLDGSVFFQAQAQMAQQLGVPDKSLPLGYCFSYPAPNTEDADAVLLRWTKGLEIDGVIGKKVGRLMRQALEEVGYQIAETIVLNDTVASLLGGVHLYADARFGQNYVGLILGTGSNMAGVFPSEKLQKVDSARFRDGHSMVVNLESGNFHPPHLSQFDEAVDSGSNNPGQQRFEKAVSGHYLPFLFNSICPGVLDPTEGTGALVQLRTQGVGRPAKVADVILKRSAHLAAAALAGLISLYPPGDTAILGEGGLLWGDPHYAQEMESTLSQLTEGRTVELLRQRDNVNLIGAASAALSRQSLKVQ